MPRSTLIVCAGMTVVTASLAAPSCTTTNGPIDGAGADLDAAIGADAPDTSACWSSSAGSGLTAVDLDASADATPVGCAPLSSFPVCMAPSGSTLLLDGAVVGPDGGPGTEVCTNACGTGEYAQACAGTSPDPSIQCTVIPIPTPSAFTYYCCACPNTTP